MLSKHFIASAIGAFVTALVLMLVLVNPARAQDTNAADSTTYPIDRVQREAAFREAQLRLAKANAELAKYHDSSDGTSGDVAAPFCSEVYGAPNDYKAVFLYSDNSQVPARRGDHIPGGWVVESVALDRVVITRDGHSHVCGFSSTAPQAPAPATNQLNASPTPMFPGISAMQPPSPNH